MPHSARVWNYLLGGKDNYPVDRKLGDAILQASPGLADVARTSREFLGRAIRHLAGEAGVRQFLDIGTGLPTADNTHEIAQRVAPESRIVYVDNDPLVLTHARALLTSSPEGATDYLHADVRDPDAILRAAAETLDFTRPVVLILMGVMGHIADHGEALAVMRRLMGALPSGSYLVHYDGTSTSASMVDAQERYNDSDTDAYHVRTPEQMERAFEGLEVLEPGVVPCTHWRPEPGTGTPRPVDAYCGVGRKP
ncbi:SAM-dependent methyltransferase [Streptomyces glaucosporus]|uniref:SAM-dependent methyltransferase n=1 Tax=Streptomyces glaucosporus TaxID=284044 RepID=A0ABN3IIU5_9ACTN